MHNTDAVDIGHCVQQFIHNLSCFAPVEPLPDTLLQRRALHIFHHNALTQSGHVFQPRCLHYAGMLRLHQQFKLLVEHLHVLCQLREVGLQTFQQPPASVALALT